MNFKAIPGFQVGYGYPVAPGVNVGARGLPYLSFRPMGLLVNEANG